MNLKKKVIPHKLEEQNKKIYLGGKENLWLY